MFVKCKHLKFVSISEFGVNLSTFPSVATDSEVRENEQ